MHWGHIRGVLAAATPVPHTHGHGLNRREYNSLIVKGMNLYLSHTPDMVSKNINASLMVRL